jgi:hypothetical protein
MAAMCAAINSNTAIRLPHSNYFYERGFIMQNVTNDKWYCGNCKFFSAENLQQDHNELQDFENDTEGECRGTYPVLGEIVKDHHGDDFRCYAEWPKVFASEWCSHFEHK